MRQATTASVLLRTSPVGSEDRGRYGRPPPQLAGEGAPAETRPGVGLAAGRNVLVANDSCQG
jgi:hypothetical protein